jgi:hypothetical protein
MESRDGDARRKVADQVREVVIEAASDVAREAIENTSGERSQEAMIDAAEGTYRNLATAASAVVLASDLRAPAEDGQVFEYDKYGNSRPVNESPSPFRVPSGGVSPNRQGWRARLAHVERLLHGAAVNVPRATAPSTAAFVDEALAEVRAMIDEAE